MERLESIAFLALCLGLPLVMAALLLRHFVRWLLSRRREGRAVKALGWEPSGDGALREALEDAGLQVGERTRLFDVRQRRGLVTARCHRRALGGARSQTSGERRALLVVPREAPGPRGVAQPKTGGLLESIALGLGEALGARALDPEGWSWAHVHGPGGWLSAEDADAVRALLGPQDRLHLGARHVVLSRPAEHLDGLLEDGPALSQTLRRL